LAVARPSWTRATFSSDRSIEPALHLRQLTAILLEQEGSALHMDDRA
jgi:hypothetical protein